MKEIKIFLQEFFSSPITKGLLLLGILLHFLFFFIIKVNQPTASKETPHSFISILETQTVASNSVIEDQAILFDTEPIILPTIWNYGKQPLAKLKALETITPFQSFDPIITLSQVSLLPSSLDKGTNTSPVITLQADYWAFCTHFAQEPKPITPLKPRQAFLQVKDMATGKIVKTTELNTPDLQEPIIEKLEFLALINSIQSKEPALHLNTTGSDEIDFEAKHKVNTSLNAWNLPNGYYKISIGP